MRRLPSAASSLAALSLVFFSTPPAAQQANNAGPGTIKRFFDATAQTPGVDVTIAGVAYVNGKTYAGSAGTGSGPVIYEFTNGKRTNQFSAPLTLLGTFDLDTDGTVIFAADTTGVIVFDTTGKTTNLKIQAKNGAQTLAKNPIPSPLAGIHAVAYDRNGNNGNGSLFVAQEISTSPIVEIDLTGKQLRSFANQGWTGSGLTVDPRTGNLWCMHDGTTNIIELDIKNSLKPTGVKFPQLNAWALRCCGGLCGIPGGDRNTYASDFDLAVLTRLPGDDYIVIHRGHLFPGIVAADEAELVGSINSTTLNRGAAGDGNLGVMKASDTLRWALRPGPSGKKNQPAIVTFSFGPDASVDGLNFGGLLLPEWRVLSPFSVPPSAAMLFLPPQLVGGPPAAVPIPAGILRCFELFRLQAIVIELPAPAKFVATNEVWAYTSDEKSCNVIVEAVGANSLNNDTTKGFWRVIHRGGLPPIDAVTFDWIETRNPAQASMLFDTDNPGMADLFNAGNSTNTGCKGTYRNGSDAATGLIYDNQNTPVNVCASPGANSGFMGSNPINAANDFLTLTFRFQRAKFFGTPQTPKIFEFDCDTDGGIGVDGASMAGCVITITLLGGRKIKGELRPDTTSTTSRSVAGF